MRDDARPLASGPDRLQPDRIRIRAGLRGKEHGRPIDRGVEATLNHFEKAFRKKQDFDACKFLTPRSLREFVAAEAKDPGHLGTGTFRRACPLYLRILSKGVKVPRVTIDVEEVVKKEFRDRFYLVVFPSRGPSVVMNSKRTKIAIFAGPEKGD